MSTPAKTNSNENREMRLDEIGRLVSGSTPSTSNPENWNGPIMWLTPADLSELTTRHITKSARTLTQAGLDRCAAHLLPARSLVISSRAPIGHMALPLSEFCTNQGCKSIEFFDGQDPDFHYYNLRHWVKRIRDKGEGTTFAEISKTALASVRVPVPADPKVQSKVAEVLMTVDRAIEQTEALLAKQQRIKAGLIHGAIQCGIDEVGHLRRLSSSHPSFEHQIPPMWKAERFGKFIERIDSGWSPVCESAPAVRGEFGSLKTSAITWDGYEPGENKRIPHDLEAVPALFVQADEILITRVGPKERVGVVVHVEQTPDRLMISENMLRLKLRHQQELLPAFVPIILGSHLIQSEWEKRKVGLAEAQVVITQKIVRETLIPIPSPGEQERILALDSSIHSLINLERSKLEKLRRQKAGLMHDLLTGRVPVTPLLATKTT